MAGSVSTFTLDMFYPLSFTLPPDSPVRLYHSNEINSTSPDCRQRVRKKIYEVCRDLGFKDESILDLEVSPPKVPMLSLSLSHCPKGSLFAVAQQSQPIGVDIEMVSRLNASLIERVSNNDELAAVPQGVLLFSAKEATWKSISGTSRAVATISHIQTNSWVSVGRNAWRFNAQTSTGPLSGYGLVHLGAETTLAFFSL